MTSPDPKRPATPAKATEAETHKPKRAGKDQAKRDKKLDVVEEAGWESFPASDAPSWTP